MKAIQTYRRRGFQSHDYLEAYCNKACADRKSPPAVYEDDPDYEAKWEAR